MRVPLVVLALVAAATAAALRLPQAGSPAQRRPGVEHARDAADLRQPEPATVVFPDSAPTVGTGPGAIVWLGSGCPTGPPTLDAAVLRTDAPGPPRSLTTVPLTRFAALAGTTAGQLVALAGAGGRALLGDGFATQGFARLRSLPAPTPWSRPSTYFRSRHPMWGGHPPAEIVTRAQRHYMRPFGRAVAIRAGRGTARLHSRSAWTTALTAEIVQDERGEMDVCYVTNDNHVKRLGKRPGLAGAISTDLRRFFSDDDRAFYIWTPHRRR